MSVLDWRRLQAEATIVDLHIHPAMQQSLFNRSLGVRYVINRTLHGNPLSVRGSFPRLRDGGYDVILSAIHVPEQNLRNDFPLMNIFRLLRPDLWKKLIAAPPFDATLYMMDSLEKGITGTEGYGAARMACTKAELEAILRLPKAHSDPAEVEAVIGAPLTDGPRPLAVIHAVEGAHSLGGYDATDAEVMQNLEKLALRGVAMLTLAHFYPNRVVHPCYPFPEDIARLAAHPTLWRDLTLGLTPLGRRVVERMIELGMLIDLSHSTPTARREVYEIAEASGKRVPLIASHVGAYEINPSPYNLHDWEIRRIARDGGVVGVIFMPYWLMPKESRHGVNAISRHICHLFETGGEDVVGIGTDFDGFTTPPDELDNVSQFPRLTQRLVVDGYDEGQIFKILGGNALRAIRDGWGR